MDLRTFLKTMDREAREAFAQRCETSVGHLNNVAGGHRPCATDLAVLIEHNSQRQVTRQELRCDWPRHWPELSPEGSGTAVVAGEHGRIVRPIAPQQSSPDVGGCPPETRGADASQPEVRHAA